MNTTTLTWAALALTALGSLSACTTDAPTGPAPVTISGTVTASTAGDVRQTVIVACRPLGENCDPAQFESTSVDTGGKSAAYRLENLPSGPYYLFGWKDNNGSQEVDDGDDFAVYSTDGRTPAVVTASTASADLVLGRLATSEGGGVSGQVRAAPGGTLADVTVFSCVPGTDGACDPRKITTSRADPQGRFLLLDPPTEPFYVMAWQDQDRNGQLSDADAFGSARDAHGALVNVQAPRSGVTVYLTAPTGGANPGAGVPSALTGHWYRGTSTLVDYYNPTTGQWSPPSGSGTQLKINADGTFTRSVTGQLSTYGCTTTTFGYYTGTVAVTGNTLTLNPTYSRQKYTNDCTPSMNSDRDVPNEALQFRWAIDPRGELILTWPDGAQSTYGRN
ncbi:hypothetical protein [Deinococcus pimensis]|uniref:hypothetical protein n=1 Tax=Deinococcus pimensis TaxID=309888 RepID=UPI0004873A6A|nr:hypothetical protein [Deinococcus pimensis]